MVEFKNQLVANKEDVSAMFALAYLHSDARKYMKFPWKDFLGGFLPCVDATA
jgi:hypothetical protein